MPTVTVTSVVIIGAGPAGLAVAQLLANRGVTSVVLDHRTRDQIENTHRAGILDAHSVALLGSEVSTRYQRDGYEQTGFVIRVNGVDHRIDVAELTGASLWLYPQTDVFIDLADACERTGVVVHFGVRDLTTDRGPTVRFVTADGQSHRVEANYLVGADGAHSMCRALIGDRRAQHWGYPLAWVGVLCEAPRTCTERLHATSAEGLALISPRSAAIQRIYLQCAVEDTLTDWPDARIWEAVAARVGPGVEVPRGPIFERTLVSFTGFAQQSLWHDRVVLVGDAAHLTPPTGSRGLNLALADAGLLAAHLVTAVRSGDPAPLARYADAASARAWRAQRFSHWLTLLLHAHPGDVLRLPELERVLGDPTARTALAQAYAGWPTTELSL